MALSRFKKGDPRPPGAGRKPGQKNRDGLQLKHMILTALDNAGGTEYLTQQAKKNPAVFLKLVAQCIPKDIKLGHNVQISIKSNFDVLDVTPLTPALPAPGAVDDIVDAAINEDDDEEL